MTDAAPIGSVLIPAWNEASVIRQTLEVLFEGIDVAPFEVVVACNGCTDGTADVVRATGLPITVLELPGVGKAGAIRAAEAATSVLPRLYLDADTRLPRATAITVLEALGNGVIAGRPQVAYETTSSSPIVRRFYAVRSSLPGVASDLCGAGVYGLSATARRRFGDFPSLIADDLFAARLVTSTEVEILDGAPAVVATPRDVASLVHVLARVYRGNREMARAMPGVARSTTGSTARGLVAMARHPARWLDIAAYAAIVVAGRLASARRSSGWERDRSSRATEE